MDIMKKIFVTGAAVLVVIMAHANVPNVLDDSIPSIVPLFDPILIEDKQTFEGEPSMTDLLKMGYDTNYVATRSESAYKIGTPATDATVSSFGAAVWSMTFDAPQGVGGMMPSVGLVYSSQSENGNVGWGVSISGVSCITRGLKTHFHDSTVSGVKYAPQDALFLDGRRLLLFSGTEGTTGAIYYPEGDPYTKVMVTSANSTTGPLAFEVTPPNGHIMKYGSTANSRNTFTDVNSIQRVHSWCISRDEDSNGNYVDYSYVQDHLVMYPQTISYGKNTHTGTGADNYIRFDYTDVYTGSLRTFVIAGVRGGVYKCLCRVRTMTGSTIYRDYHLGYTTVSDGTTKKFQRLTSVTCKNASGQEMKPVTLEWCNVGETDQTAEILDVCTNDVMNNNIQKIDSLLLATDLNGDGLADIVRISNCMLIFNGYTIYRTYAYVHRSQKTDTGVIYLSPLRYELEYSIDLDIWKNILGGNTVADIDGDGLNDLLIPYYKSQNSDKIIDIKVILGGNVRYGGISLLSHTMVLSVAENMPPFISGDFDSNGIDDLVCLEDKTIGGHYPLNIDFSMPNNGCDRVTIPLSLSQKPKRLFTGDFNSDGLPDIIVLYNGGYKVFFNNGGNTASSIFSDTNSVSGTSFGDKWRVEQGDFNGDGLVDFVYVAGNSSYYYYALNNGDGTFAVSLAIDYGIHDQATDRDDNRFTLVPMDIDRDGITDLVVAKAVFVHTGGAFGSDQFSRTEVGWLISDGASLSEIRHIQSPYQIEDAGMHNIMTGDFDGDGKIELANNGTDWYTYTNAIDDGCHIRVYHATDFTSSTGNLTSVTDGLGATTSFQYDSSATPVFYTHTYENSYPLTDHHSPVTLVSKIQKDDGLTGIRSTLFRYMGLKQHRQGKGMLGFSEFSARDSITGETRLSGTLLWNTNHYVPDSIFSVTYMGEDINSTFTKMNVTSMTKGRYVSFPSVIRNIDMDGNLTNDSLTYNTTYGYLQVKKTEYGNSSMYKKTQYSNYVQKSRQWLPQLVTTSQKHLDASTIYCYKTTHTYDSAGNTLTTCLYPDSAMQLTTTNTYDSYGNLLSSYQTGNGVPQVTNFSVYDTTGRFVTRRYQNVDSGETLLTYDQWGNVLTYTEAVDPSNPLVTSYTYDGWGDMTSVTSPEGAVTTFSMGWGGTSLTKYYKLETCPGKPWMKTWYDVRGRTAQTESKGPCNVDVVTTFMLNGWGKMREQISREGTRVTYARNDLDHRGRPTHSYTTGQGSTYYTYGNRSSIATNDGRAFSTIYDAWGNLVESTDPECTITYTYGSNGLPTQVEADDGQTSSVCSMEYDIAGHRTRLDDPDAGTITCTYTPDGRILSRTDARGIQTVNTYDSMGRLSMSVCDTLVTSYTYGSTGYGKMRIVREETNDMANEYTYNPYGRIIFDKRIYSDGFMSGHTYTYDAVGHVTRHIFPSGLNVDYTYDNNGYMTALSCNNTDVWGTRSYDGWSGVEAFGNTTITTNVERVGRLVERYVQHNNSTTKLHRMVFTWDSIRGNLCTRMGVIGANVTESFTYDYLDRLTGVSSAGQPIMAMTYAANGIILSKSDMGSYTYSATHPHAIVGVDNTDYLINITSQQIEYNPWGKVSHITEGTHTQELLYGPDKQRWKVIDRTNGQETGRLYPHANYEWRNASGQTLQFHYLENGVIALKIGNNDFWYYHSLTDNVNSIIKVISGEGTAAFEASYDAWGTPTISTNLINFPRGFGGHEMLSEYRLVNMDGRMYDYSLGRFLSPDIYVQEPTNSQSFNRYSYCLNNPLKYTDPSGDLWLPIISGLFKGLGRLISGRGHWYSPFYEAYKNSVNDLKLFWGLFKGSPRQLLSRFTWELPQTIIGLNYTHYIKLNFHDVDEVRYFDGATYIINKTNKSDGVTIGSFININTSEETPYETNGSFAPYKNQLYAHEYGHYIQSQHTGWGYLFSHGIPSLYSAIINNNSKSFYRYKEHNAHRVFWTEIDASSKAADYFIKKGYLISWPYSKYPTN